jgi:hypothetical protein
MEREGGLVGQEFYVIPLFYKRCFFTLTAGKIIERQKEQYDF